MKKLKFLGVTALAIASLASCSNDSENVIKNPASHEVKLKVIGEVFANSKQKASGDDFYAVQIFESDASDGVYAPKMAGLFDDIDDVKFPTEVDKFYTVKVAAVAKGKGYVYNAGTTYGYPLADIVDDTNNELNKFYANTTNLVTNFKEGGIQKTDDAAKITYYSSKKRFYGEVKGITHDAFETTITAKIGYFKLNFDVVKDLMAENTGFKITLQNADGSKKGEEILITKADINDDAEDAKYTEYFNLFNIAPATAVAADDKEDIKIHVAYGVIDTEFQVKAESTLDINGDNDVKRKHEYSIKVTGIDSKLVLELEDEGTFTEETEQEVTL